MFTTSIKIQKIKSGWSKLWFRKASLADAFSVSTGFAIILFFKIQLAMFYSKNKNLTDTFGAMVSKL